MAKFKYTARSRAGERVTGVIEAADRRAALSQIERLGHTPVSVSESGAPPAPPPPAPAKAPAKTAAPAAPKKKRFVLERQPRHPRLKVRDVLLFTRELSDLLASGMTLGDGLHTLSKRQTRRAQDQVIVGLRDEIVKGASLSTALGQWPESFSHLYVNMVKAGEASGELAEVLQRLCQHYERVQAAREKVISALIYPAIVLSMGILTMIFSMVFVVPRFTAVFRELGSTLPLPTRILVGISNILIRYGLVILLALLGLVILLRRAVRTPSGRRTWHRIQLRAPLVRHIVTANAYGQFARTLGALLQNGVPVLQALSIVEDTMSNAVIADAVKDARNRVTDGATISGPLAAGKVFPPLLTDMLAVGEEAGDISSSLIHISKRYEEELDRSVKVFTTVLEPLLMLLMAVMVGFVAVSMLLAVFDLTSGLNV
jgi:type IV pilus assembly protein PilC